MEKEPAKENILKSDFSDSFKVREYLYSRRVYDPVFFVWIRIWIRFQYVVEGTCLWIGDPDLDPAFSWIQIRILKG